MMNNHNQPLRTAASDQAGLWHSQLGDAIKHSDEARMWQLINTHDDQEEAHEALATLVSRMAYRVGERVRFNEMFLLPVIQPAGNTLIGNDGLWKQASFAISEALDTWLGKRTFKTVFNGVRPFDWVSTWRTGIIRSHLMRTVPGAHPEKISAMVEDIVLPRNAPQLGFICMVLTSEHGWPQLPATNTMRDERLKKVVGFALDEGNTTSPRPIVLTPDRVQFALPDAVGVWLLQLHETIGILGWSAIPIASTPDVVKITLRLHSDEVPWTQFVLRKHQTGLQGLDDTMRLLASLSPFMDTPNDMPASERKLRATDLT